MLECIHILMTVWINLWMFSSGILAYCTFYSTIYRCRHDTVYTGKSSQMMAIKENNRAVRLLKRATWHMRIKEFHVVNNRVFSNTHKKLVKWITGPERGSNMIFSVLLLILVVHLILYSHCFNNNNPLITVQLVTYQRIRIRKYVGLRSMRRPGFTIAAGFTLILISCHI